MDVTEKIGQRPERRRFSSSQGLGAEDRVAVYAFDRDLYRLSDFTTIEAGRDRLPGPRSSPSAPRLSTTPSSRSGAPRDPRGLRTPRDRRRRHRRGRHLERRHDPSNKPSEKAQAAWTCRSTRSACISPVDDPESDLFLGVHGASYPRCRRASVCSPQETGGVDVSRAASWGQLAARFRPDSRRAEDAISNRIRPPAMTTGGRRVSPAFHGRDAPAGNRSSELGRVTTRRRRSEPREVNRSGDRKRTGFDFHKGGLAMTKSECVVMAVVALVALVAASAAAPSKKIRRQGSRRREPEGREPWATPSRRNQERIGRNRGVHRASTSGEIPPRRRQGGRGEPARGFGA